MLKNERKMKLQEVTDYKVMSIKECLEAFGWTYEENEDGYNNIQCPCGGKMDFRGFFGVEVIECQKCGKHMIDLFSPLPVSQGACKVLNPKDFEVDDNRYWIAIDNNGGIKKDVI